MRWGWQSVIVGLVDSDNLYPLMVDLDKLEEAHELEMKPLWEVRSEKLDKLSKEFTEKLAEHDKQVGAAIVEYNRAEQKHRDEFLKPRVRALLLEALAEGKEV